MIGFILAALGVISGFGKIAVRQFEIAAAKDILTNLSGPAAKVDVQTKLNGIIGGPLGDIKEATIRASEFQTAGLPLFTEPWRSKKGLVRNLKIELSNFELGKLRVESLSASIPDCRYDYSLATRRKVIRLSKSGVGTGTVRLRAKDLEAFILKKFAEIKKVAVRIEKDKVFVDGYGEFVIVRTNFSVIATLGSPDGKTLELQNARIFFDDKPAEEAARKVLLETLNPVVDLNKDLKLHDAISIQGIRLFEGFLEAWGATRIPDSPEKPSGLALHE